MCGFKNTKYRSADKKLSSDHETTYELQKENEGQKLTKAKLRRKPVS